MAQVSQSSRYPNLLILSGDDVYGNDESILRAVQALYAPDATALVEEGSHDLWMVHRIPNPTVPGWQANHTNATSRSGPRRLRGVVHMSTPSDDSDSSMQDYLTTAIHEAGHCWLVPNDIAFRTGGGISMLGEREQVQRVHADVEWGQPPLLGRDRAHWSVYLDGASFEDGVGWLDRGDQHGLRRWDQQNPPDQYAVDGVTGRRAPVFQFNDLDLILLDAVAPSDAFPQAGNAVRWLEPLLIGGVDYHAGLTVIIGAEDWYYFGFYRDHRTIAVAQNGNPPVAILELGDDADFNDAVQLRVVRAGGRLLFQAAPAAVPLLGGPDDGGRPDPTTTGLDPLRYRTVFSISEWRACLAVGPALRTWSSLFVQTEVDRVEIVVDGQTQVFDLSQTPPDQQSVDITGDLVGSQLRRFQVVDGTPDQPASSVTAVDGRLRLSAAWGWVPPSPRPATAYDPANDRPGAPRRSPKALVGLGHDRDFTFAVSSRMRRAVFSPVAGGAAVGTTMWGRARSLPAADFVVPEATRSRWGGDAELDVAFVVVAARPSDATDAILAPIEQARRLFDSALAVTTRDRWTSNSELRGRWARFPGASFTSGPAMVSWAANRLDVFALGDDRRMYHMFYQDDHWGDWEPLSFGTFTTPPAVVSWAAHRLDVFAVGDDRRMYHMFYQDDHWGEWEPLGFGTFTSPPAAVSWGANRLDVFAVGDDRRMYHMFYQSDHWGDWEPLGFGTFSGPPAAVSWGSNRLDAFALGDDSKVYHAWFGQEAWHHWAPLQSPAFIHEPAVTSWSAGRLDLVGVDQRRRMYRAGFDNGWGVWGH